MNSSTYQLPFVITESYSVEKDQNMSRANLLAKLAVAPLAIGAFAALKIEEADAAKTAKSAVQYVTHPVGGKQCSACRFFKAGKTAKAAGQCSIVDGSIAPNAYCVAFAAKS
ncbi:MAG: high-potential iron-sulfur protein [Candidatus Eremiobacteraeota bacterium]|nr:high-potential iron-sulfur protein [Candidatus Eremiobacteraeota bacterium]